MKTLSILLFMFVAGPAFSSGGVILAKKGSASVLRSFKEGEKSLLFEGKTYSYKEAKVGQKVRPRDLIKCDPNCKVKVGFRNGDTMMVGPGSAVEMPYKAKSKGKATEKMSLKYGKLRAIVSKRGPRKNLQIRTQSAVAGVRGTDLFTTYYESTGQHTSVIRGEVEVNPIVENKVVAEEKVVIKSGQVAKVETPPAPEQVAQTPVEAAPKAEVRDLNRAELEDIVKTSDVKVEKEAIEELAPEQQQEVAQIEKLAMENTIAEIKEETPELFDKLGEDVGSDQINVAAVEHLEKNAKEGELQWDPKEEVEKHVKGRHFEDAKWWNDFEISLIDLEQTTKDHMSGHTHHETQTSPQLAWTPQIFAWGRLHFHGRIGIRLVDIPKHENGMNTGEESQVSDLIGLRATYRFTKWAIGFGVQQIYFDGKDFNGPELTMRYRLQKWKIESFGLVFGMLENGDEESPDIEDAGIVTRWVF